jgi:hypothetical protein
MWYGPKTRFVAKGEYLFGWNYVAPFNQPCNVYFDVTTAHAPGAPVNIIWSDTIAIHSASDVGMSDDGPIWPLQALRVQLNLGLGQIYDLQVRVRVLHVANGSDNEFKMYKTFYQAGKAL